MFTRRCGHDSLGRPMAISPMRSTLYLKWEITQLIAFILLAGCGSSELTSQAIEGDIIYTLRMPRTTFTTRDTLSGIFEVWNFSNRDRQFDFPVQQKFGFVLLRESRDTVLRYPEIEQPASSSFTLSGGEKKRLPFRCPLTAWHRSVAPGKYTLRACLWTFAEGPGVELPIEVK